MNTREFHLSLFLEVIILKIDKEGKIKKILLNTKEDFDTTAFRTIFDLFSSEEETRLKRLLESGIQVKKKFVKLSKKTKLEEYVDVEISIKGEEIFFFIQFFASQRKREVLYDRHVEKLASFSKKDPMTKVLNRQGFEEQLRFLIKRSNSKKIIGIIFVDIDNLKKINDTHGHGVGDKAILWVTNILVSAVRGRDLIARWGGDEFLILVEEVTGEKSSTYGLAQRLLKKKNKEKKTEYSTTVSLGVHVFEVGNLVKYLDDFDRFADECHREINVTDKAAYEAKKNGRNKLAVSDDYEKHYKLLG